MTKQLTFVILSSGLDNFKELRTALASQEGARVLVGGDDAEQVFPEIERLNPNAVIVALGAEPESGLRFVERVARGCPRTAVICAARDSSPDTILRSIRAGAREFLRLPARAEEFATVYRRVAEFCAVQPEAPKKRGRVISVFSSKGGTGTTFVATNVAASLRAPSVLVDLNLHAGDLGLFLGVEPKFSVADLIENRKRVDDQLRSEFCAVQPEAPKKRGRVISVFSSKGGTGTTFVATNVAASLRAPSVLVDLNLHAGDLGLFLGVEPKFSVADLIENRKRVDDQL